MKCKHAKTMISPYIDAELAGAEINQFLAHIEACAECRHELEETKALSRMFASAERASAPYGFNTRVLAEVAADKNSWNRLSNIFRPFFVRAAEAAFASIIIIVGIIAGSMLITKTATPANAVGIRTAFHLDAFEAAPPDSIGGVYVVITGGHYEK
jgi:anti-sigma factor RsiW